MATETTKREGMAGSTSPASHAVPKYRHLAQRLRRQIADGQLRVGDRLPSFPQMRQRWGATQKTVEQAYALLEKDGLILRRNGSGVYVAEQRMPAATGIVAIDNGFPAHHPYFLRLLSGVHDAARACKIEVLLLHDDSRIPVGKVDGVLTFDRFAWHFMDSLPPGLPQVSLLQPNPGTPCVKADDRSAVSNAVAYLVGLGHRRIGYITTGHLVPESLQSQRVAGYSDGLGAAGIKAHDNWLRPQQLAEPVEHDYRKFGYQEMKQWLSTDWNEVGCTALLAHNDETALGVLDALEEAAIQVPAAVSVVGFDCLGQSHPSCGSLTSVSVPLYEIGARGIKMLLDIIQAARQPATGADQITTIEIPALLKPGGSTARVTAASE